MKGFKSRFLNCAFVVPMLVTVLGMQVFLNCTPSEKTKPGWPSISREMKPWTRWWWHGSALTKDGITAEMVAYQKAGIGGLEITPIYGVMGYEDKFVDFLSPEWMELLIHTLKEAERLDLGIDMATGTGWPFGGPWVKDADACQDMNYKVYQVRGGSSLPDIIEFIQQPLLRAIGNPIFQNSVDPNRDRNISVVEKPVMRLDPKSISINQLVEPIGSNKNLQALALDQVKFEKKLSLNVLMAYDEKGKVINLTGKVNAEGKLQWVAPAGNWKLYAVFGGWHGKMVERAGPGGEGNVIDHFSADALKHYLNRFDSAFKNKDTHTLRAFFNDSYEVDDARGTADWTPALFEEFKRIKGYDLREHLPALFGEDTAENNKRILCDYRETISELLLNNFTRPWKSWAHGHTAIVRNQAHGSPSNILDLYATVDIPEIEGTEPLRIKMASSAGNVAGKKLVSSESATWLNEHFESTLADVKEALDRFMLNGVNHIFYHGTSYSPPGEPWPGWLFYAAVHFNPRNSFWEDFDALNQYVARCQSMLQNSKPDNDVLLYYPIYDRFSTPGKEMIEHFDGIEKQFAHTAFARAAHTMLENGYAFDYISDKQIGDIRFENGILITEGKSQYKTLVIPHGHYIPLATFKKIVSLAEKGATIIALEGFPDSTAGYLDFNEQEKVFEKMKSDLSNSGLKGEDNVVEMKSGRGRILLGDSLQNMLVRAAIRKESVTDLGIQFIRKQRVGAARPGILYFVANSTDQPFDGWLPLATLAGSAIGYDPMDGNSGALPLKVTDDDKVEVYIQLNPQQSFFIETFRQQNGARSFPYYSASGHAIPLSGPWKITFTSGGPELPSELKTDSLTSWTTFGNQYEAFSGSATYALEFKRPDKAVEHWLLDLGGVKESAEVTLNGHVLGTLIGPVYQLDFDASKLLDVNLIEVRVSNLMANRIADMDRKNIFWKKFYNVNFPARNAENRKNGLFDASQWKPKDSGLLGPVRLFPVEQKLIP